MQRRHFVALAIATISVSGCLGDDEAPTEPEYGDWFAGVPHFDGFEDYTDRNEVTVLVGTGEQGVLFDPPAITVTPGTDVVFEWTGDGGQHNVEEADGDWQNPEGLVEEAGHSWTRTFDDPGTHRYKCWPHAGAGMKGAVFVDAHSID